MNCKLLSKILLLILLTCSCRHEDVIFIPEDVEVANPQLTDVKGFYLLNEGNMGSNKCTLDMMDFATGIYTRNIYGEANPDVPMELGDVGNALLIYGTRLYAVINCSNKVEVMDAKSCRRIGSVDIPNCRMATCKDGYLYVTSYAGPVEISQNYRQRGYVAKIDTTTLQVVAQCVVGYQPDGIAVAGDKLYVANSGGYMAPNYENRMSVIDIPSFSVVDEVEIALNLNLILADRQGKLWVSSRGNYGAVEPSLTCYDTRKQRIVKVLPITVGSMCICGDSIYTVGGKLSYGTTATDREFGIVNISTMEEVSTKYITDGTESNIKLPYGVAVNPATRDIFVTDAGNFVNPGYLHCYDREGRLRWSVRTGDIPAHITFF